MQLAIVNCTALLGTEGDEARFVNGVTVEIDGGRIAHIDTAPTARPIADEVIDARGMVLMPGLVNTHCHMAMTLMRGAAEDVPVEAWFNDYIWPMEVNLAEGDVYLGAMVAAAEMIRCGVTTVADNYFQMDEVARAITETGMRANLGWAFFSTQGDDGLAVSEDFARRWNGAADGRIATSITPHAPYTVHDEHLVAAAEAARRLGVKVHVHAAEDMHQTEVSLAQRGITPIEVLRRTGVLDAGCIIAHGNGIIADDIPALAEHADRVGVTHGPKGYLKMAIGPLTPITALRAAGVAVGYCTDGAASNNTLDIFENMRITAIVQKQLAGDATAFRTGTALAIAGDGSARVLGLGGQVGTLREGACADVILVDTSGFHMQPLHDLAAALVYCVQPSDVHTTIVAGRVLMRDRNLLTIDTTSLMAEFHERARHITDRSHGRTIQDYPRD